MTWTGNVLHTGEMRNAYRVLVRKHEGKEQLERPRSRREYNSKIELKEIGCDSVKLPHVAQDRN